MASHPPAKGILKRPKSTEALESEPDTTTTTSQQHLKWDEANIIWTEATRTATMKIDEPKTPFVRPEEITALEMAENQANLPVLQLDSGSAGSRCSLSSFSGPSQSDFSDHHLSTPSAHEEGELDPEEAQRRHAEFERRRLEHYNMKEAMRKARELVQAEEEASYSSPTE